MKHNQVRYPIVWPTLPDFSELQSGIRAVIASGRVTVGEQVAGLEADVRARLGVSHCIAVSSGTSGLMLLLRALNLPKGSEVVTPTFTFAATAQALLWNGLKPVFCDSEPDSFTMSASAAESLITERTSAIYPVCVFGVPGDMDAYLRLADKHGLALLFDSAQGLGSSYRGTPVGNFGAGEAFSMSPTKVVTAVEGGLVTTNDGDLARRIRQMRDYGKAPDGEDMQWLGLSARMTEFNALVARWSLARIDTWVANRAAIMRRYEERLREIPGVSFQRTPPHCVSSRNYIVALFDPEISPITRDDLYERLKQDGVQTKRYFYPALHNQTLFRDIGQGCAARLPIAEKVSSSSLALPMYSHMPIDTVDYVCDRILAHSFGKETEHDVLLLIGSCGEL
ncbi:MAG: DegT/DnrJ/EryC1/StrS family aminotransferase [Armatimonadota bacterium]|nr:DegT/DnrJ/EryC1/StrS family aminotransferase [Armatimonadota bacterium]